MDVKTLCLGALTLRDASGYEIRKLFEEGPFGHFYDASYGSIYPALAYLLKEGLVSVTETQQDGRPDKKVYSLTPGGLSVFKAALAEKPTRDRIRSEHMVRFFFADYMDPDDLKLVFDTYLAEFRAMSEKIRSLDNQNISQPRLFTRGFGLAFYDGVAAYMEENRDQLLTAPSADTGVVNFQNGKLKSVGAGDDD